MVKFIIEVNEGETECKKCPFYSKDLKCSKLVCENDIIYDFDFLICTDYDLSTLKVKIYEKKLDNLI